MSTLTERMADINGSIDRAPTIRPTGQEIFNNKSPAEQDAMLGPKAAEAVRTGAVSLDELVQREPLETDQPDFITQKPLPQEGD